MSAPSSKLAVPMNLATGIFIILALVIKMVGLEPYRIEIYPFQITIVAILLPLAMIFGRYGIAGMTAGCVSAHTVFFNGVGEIFAAGSAAFAGSYLSYLLVKKWREPLGIFAGSWIVTATWSLVMGSYLALTGNTTFLQEAGLMFWRLWIPVSLIGFAATLFMNSLLDRKTLNSVLPSAWEAKGRL